jgi:NADH-quinone oxidoreductase subunit L
MEKYLYIALFAPLVGSLIAAVFGNTPKKVFVGVITSSLIFVSFFASFLLLLWTLNGNVVKAEMMDWISAGNFSIPFGFVADQVSTTMMVVVSFVSAIVHVHSMGYMSHDKGYNRYFSYLSAFVFSMMILVMSDNLLGLFIGWEGVGLCSWLLVGFWYHKKDEPVEVNSSISPSWAANEAFIMNRVADLAMLVGIFIIFWNIGSVRYDDIFASVETLSLATIVSAGVFLFIGAMGKSAQFPFHPWLADAMEGPTPVSALIHAATMVTAGVFLVVRMAPMYELIPEVGYAIACLGAFVAMFAATMGLVHNNLKKVIAYSTLSQLGYMFVAAGLGAYWIALFHLATHAFFKSVLFLGAGNVMHAMDDELNIKKMGGLYKTMKGTAIIMILASLALAGIYPFAGFFSKDMILEAAFAEHSYFLWTILWITAGLTAFYSFRLIMLVFFGEEKYKLFGFHPHEAYRFQIIAMIPLALLAVFAGFLEHSFIEYLDHILPQYHGHVSSSTVITLILVTSAMAIGGIAVAVYKYSKGGFDKSWENTFIYKLLINQYYIPKLYDVVFCKPYKELSTFAWKNIDLKIVDATVDFIATTIYNLGDSSRAMQTPNLSQALKWMTFGVMILLILAVAAGLK